MQIWIRRVIDMTIDEAIENLKYDIEIDMYIRDIAPQLAEWLEELKALKNGLNIKCDNLNEALEKGKKIGYKKAIDDFAEKLKRENKETIPIHSGYCRMSFDEIAEQLKAGVKE